MTPAQKDKLADLYRRFAEEEASNAVDATCEVRFVSAQPPIGKPEITGAWIHLWRWFPVTQEISEETETLGIDSFSNAEQSGLVKNEAPTAVTPDELLSQEELCERWKVSKITIQRLRKSGKLPAIQITRSLFRFKLVDILRAEAAGEMFPAIAPRRKGSRKR